MSGSGDEFTYEKINKPVVDKKCAKKEVLWDNKIESMVLITFFIALFFLILLLLCYKYKV